MYLLLLLFLHGLDLFVVGCMCICTFVFQVYQNKNNSGSGGSKKKNSGSGVVPVCDLSRLNVFWMVRIFRKRKKEREWSDEGRQRIKLGHSKHV